MRRTGPVVAAASIGIAILVGLGLWQLQRLQWKTTIIAQIEARRHAPLTSVPALATWPSLQPDDYEYRHVAVNGTFDPAKTAFVYRGGVQNAPGEGPGYLLLVPLTLPTGETIIVNRGFAPLAARDAARENAPRDTIVISGLMRSPESRNPFTPADEPAKAFWYSRDAPSIAAAFGLARVAPFTIDADADPKQSGWPRPGTTQIDIPNNHLSYALTWFGLALALIGVTAAFLWRGRREIAK